MRNLSAGDWLMVASVSFFVLAGAAKVFEKQGRLGIALVLLGVANAILLTLSRAPSAGP